MGHTPHNVRIPAAVELGGELCDIERVIRQCAGKLDLDWVEEHNPEQQTALHYAVRFCNRRLAAQLLDIGASHRVEDAYGCSPMDYVFLSDFAGVPASWIKELFELLRRKGGSPTAECAQFGRNNSAFVARALSVKLNPLAEFFLRPKVLSRVRKSYVNEWTPAHAAVQEFRRFSAHEHSFGPTLSLLTLVLVSWTGRKNILKAVELMLPRIRGTVPTNVCLALGVFGFAEVVQLLLNRGKLTADGISTILFHAATANNYSVFFFLLSHVEHTAKMSVCRDLVVAAAPMLLRCRCQDVLTHLIESCEERFLPEEILDFAVEEPSSSRLLVLYAMESFSEINSQAILSIRLFH